MMKADQERVRTLLTETVALLCKNGLHYRAELRIQGLLGVTIDGDDVFIVHLDECFTGTNNSVRASNANELESQPTVEPVNVSQFKSSRMPVSSAGYSIGHRQRRKQSSPRREIRSAQFTAEFEVQEPCSLNEPSLNLESSVDNIPSCISGTSETHGMETQIKIEQSDHTIDNSNELSLNIPIKQENTELDNGDVILIDSKDEYHDSPVISMDMLPLNARADELAEEIATNWHNDRLASREANFSQHNARINRRYPLMSNAPTTELQSPFASRSHFDGGTAGEPITDIQLLNSSKAGCSSWQISHTLDQLTRARAVVPTSQNTIREVSIALQSPAKYRRLLTTWSRCGSRVSLQSRSIRRKRYECTLEQCGRQYLNTFDLYRHQRQKHQMPADFYQQGKKQTLGIRVVDDPS